MQLLNVVLLQRDSATAQSLIAGLSTHFHSVRKADNLDDLRASAAMRRAEVAIIDMEALSITDVKRLSQDFPEVSIVCNHRLADETIWTAALDAGAVDCCSSSDTRAILWSAVQHATRMRRVAA